MSTAECFPVDRFVDIGVVLRTRQWRGDRVPFVLLHGLASNCRTWDGVARRLSETGHRVLSVDQRGHGQSQKPDGSLGFDVFSRDLARLLDTLHLELPILAGQSWGAHVLLEFGARFPGRARGFAFVDGGYLDLQARPGATWELIARELRPPDLRGRSREELRRLIRGRNPDWTEAGVDATLANFETLPDGTVRPWLSLEGHLAILRALWDQRPGSLYPRIREPVLLCAAGDGREDDRGRRTLVEAARAGLPAVEVHWFPDTAHDIHVHRPDALAELFLQTLETGVWSDGSSRDSQR